MGDQVTALDEILQRYLDSLLDKFRKLEGQNVDVYRDVNSFVQLVTFTLVSINTCHIYIGECQYFACHISVSKKLIAFQKSD